MILSNPGFKQFLSKCHTDRAHATGLSRPRATRGASASLRIHQYQPGLNQSHADGLHPGFDVQSLLLPAKA